MAEGSPAVAGIDVGGKKKGFHVAIVNGKTVVAAPRQIRDLDDVVAHLRPHNPALVAVDAPLSPAPDGSLSRKAEEEFRAQKICGIRSTPDRATINSHPTDYYGWIRQGFALYAALAEEDLSVIECFPTATFRVLAGGGKGVARDVLSKQVLEAWGLGVGRTSQDGRDALGAALTARLYLAGRTRTYGGELVVPVSQATGSASSP